MKNFMGKDGFLWFTGVVEDRMDPKRLGRLRVRCLGHHTENKDDLPTTDLPWAHPMNPITSATVSGIGQTPLGAVEGTWVVGFFSDGELAQQPIIMGTLPGIPRDLPDSSSNLGFQDPLGNFPRETNQSDVNRLAINETTQVPDTEAVGGGNQVVEFNGGEIDNEIAKSNRTSSEETIKMAQYQADLSYELEKDGFNSTSKVADITKAAATFKKNYASKYKLPANILNSTSNILTGSANHIDTITTKTISAVRGQTNVGTLLKDSILVNAAGKLYTPGNLKDILPTNLSVDAIASGVQKITSFSINDLSANSLDKFASLATTKIPGNLIKGDVSAGALKYFKSPLKTINLNPHLSSVLDKSNLTKSIGVAQMDGVVGNIIGTSGLNTSLTDLGSITADLDSLSGGAWSEPASPYNAQYPYNHVYESESGHIKEFDDTAGSERIHERHTSGSSYEIGPAGTKVTRVVKDNYEIISNDDFLHVRGTRRQTVDEGVRIRCNAKAGPLNSYTIEVGVGSNCNIEVNGGNVNVSAKGFGIGGNITLDASGNINMAAGGSINLAAGGAITETAISRLSTIQGPNINNAFTHVINATQATINTTSNTTINGGGLVDINAVRIDLN